MVLEAFEAGEALDVRAENSQSFRTVVDVVGTNGEVVGA
jgi:hypothetical protein